MSAAALPKGSTSALDLSRIDCLGDALYDATVAFNSNTALIECDRERETARLSYGDLRAVAARFGGLLQEHGIGVGDRVAILMANQPTWLTSALGVFWTGSVLVPVDYKLDPEEIAGILEHAKPRALVVDYPLWQRLSAPVAASELALLVLIAGAPEGVPLDGAMRVDGIPAAQVTRTPGCRGDTACIVYSSGTGGTPKGCMLSHGNYLGQAEVLANLFPMRETDRGFSLLPTNHAIDFMCGFLLPLLFGAAIVHQRTLRPQFIAATLRRYRITHMAVVPAILAALRRRLEETLDGLPPYQRLALDALCAVNGVATERRPNPLLSRYLLRPIHAAVGGHLRLIVCGGALVDRGDAELFYRFGIPVAIGYGLTEACTVVTVNDLEPFRGDTVGRPVPGVEVELREAGPDGVGEVWVRGNTVMQGYLDAPELTAETLIDGWLRTGDLGAIDAAGHLKLVGRSANMIVTEGGKNVYPEDVEAVLGELPGCEEYCVMARNSIWPRRSLENEDLVLVMRRSAGDAGGDSRDVDSDNITSEPLDAALRRQNQRLAVYKRLGGYLVWNEAFPRTPSLKIKRQPLAEAIRRSTEREGVVPLS